MTARHRPEASPAPEPTTFTQITREEAHDLQILVAAREGANLAIQSAQQAYNNLSKEVDRELDLLKHHYGFAKKAVVNVDVESLIMVANAHPGGLPPAPAVSPDSLVEV